MSSELSLNTSLPPVWKNLFDLSLDVTRAHIFSFDLSKREPEAEDIRLSKNSLIPEMQLKSLKEAHSLTKQLYAVFNLSQVCKTFHTMLADKQKYLSLKIVEIISKFHDEAHKSPLYRRGRIVIDRYEIYGGARYLRACIDSAHYLKVLRVYFFYKPQKLLNHANDQLLNDGYKKTILHIATQPSSRVISLHFVGFVLRMDHEHQLGLLSCEDCYGKTILDDPYRPNLISMLELIEMPPNLKEKIKFLLEQHTYQASSLCDPRVSVPAKDPPPNEDPYQPALSMSRLEESDTSLCDPRVSVPAKDPPPNDETHTSSNFQLSILKLAQKIRNLFLKSFSTISQLLLKKGFQARIFIIWISAIFFRLIRPYLHTRIR